MGFWEFMTVAVIFGSVFGYLQSLRSVSGKKRVAELEGRVAALEGQPSVAELAKRVEVLEEIVVGDDAVLQRKIHVASLAARVAAPNAARRLAVEPEEA